MRVRRERESPPPYACTGAHGKEGRESRSEDRENRGKRGGEEREGVEESDNMLIRHDNK